VLCRGGAPSAFWCLTGDFDAATSNIMTSTETYFSCRNCDALYKIIKAEGDPDGTDRIVSCLVRGELLPRREGQLVLKYFLISKRR
jgi:hypothetical protein